MKTTLTIEQSATLIAKGISADKASAALIYLNYADEEVESDRVFKREDGVLLTRLRSGMTDGVTAKTVFKEPNSRYSIPIFTLADICSLLPNELSADTIMRENDVCPIRINWDTNAQKWFVGYELVPHPVGVGVDSELIDALFSILCWAIDNEHIDLTK